MRRRQWEVARSVVLGIVSLFSLSSWGLVGAQSSSPGYRVEETLFGTGGEVDASSSSFRSQSSSGALGVGSTSSANFDAIAGFTTPFEPFLEMAVSAASVDFGILSESAYSFGAAQGGACNCSFYVRSYVSSGYIVLTVSDPPTNEGGDILDAKSVLGVPSASADDEEFGINLVDNTTPNIGANAVNVPDNTFADGFVAPGYDTPDQFKYAVGDTIAQSQATPGNPAVGRTNYTISYIAKPNTQTPAGQYTMRHTLVAVPTY